MTSRYISRQDNPVRELVEQIGAQIQELTKLERAEIGPLSAVRL